MNYFHQNSDTFSVGSETTDVNEKKQPWHYGSSHTLYKWYSITSCDFSYVDLA